MASYNVDEILANDGGALDALFDEEQPQAQQTHPEMGILGTAGDMAKGVGEGAVKAAQETAQFGYDVVNWFDDVTGADAIADTELDFVPEWLETQTTAGKLVSGVAQFLIGFVGAGKILKATKLAGGIAKLGRGAKYIEPLVKGAIVDGVMFDPHEERLSNLLVQFPILENPVTEFLAADPKDTDAEGRFKNVLEGMALGGLTDGLVSVVKHFRGSAVAKNADELIESVIKHADEADAAVSKGVVEGTQSAKLTELGLKPTEQLEVLEKAERIKNAYFGFDIEADGDALVQQIKHVEEHGRAIDAPPAGRGYERGDMLNTEGIATEEGKNIVQSVNDLSRKYLDPRIKETKAWKTAEEDTIEYLDDLRGSSYKLKKRLGFTADAADRLDETVILGKLALDDAGAKLKNIHALMQQTVNGTQAFAELEQRFNVVMKNTYEIASYMERIKTGTGRGLNMFKNANYGSYDFKGFYEKQMAELANATVQQRNGIYGRIAAVADDPVKLTKAINIDPKTGKFWALHNEFWINSVLSGLTTHLVNVLSTGVKMAFTNPLEKMLGGWGGFKGGAFTINDKALFDEGVKAYGAMFSQLGDAWKMAVTAFKSGDNILKGTSIVEIPQRAWVAETFGADPTAWTGKAINALGSIINLPTRFLMSADEFTAQLAYRAKLKIDLTQTAKRMVSEGKLANDTKAIAQFVEDNFDLAFVPKKLSNGTMLPQGTGVVKDALEEAQDVTFQTPLRKGSLSSKISSAVMEHPWLRPILPFIKTPVNILADVGRHTPGFAQVAMKSYREAMAQGGRAAAIAQGRLKVGGLIWVTGIMAAMSGNITGGGPKNKVQKEALLATGWKPYSLKVGDKYVSYGRLDPFGMILGICADFAEIWAAGGEEDAETLQTAAAMAFALPKNLTSKTYLKGLSDTLSAVMDPDKNATWVMRQRGLSYIPSFLAQTRRIVDPEMHEISGALDRIKDRIPGLSGDLPTKYSWLTGKPVIYHGGMASGISPIVFSSSIKESEIIGTELGKYAQGFTMPPETYKGVKLSTAQLSEFHRLHGTLKIGGKTLEEALVDLFHSPLYDINGETYPVHGEDPIQGRRPTMIRGVIERYRKMALRELFAKDRTLQHGVMQARRDKAMSKLRSYAQ